MLEAYRQNRGRDAAWMAVNEGFVTLTFLFSFFYFSSFEIMFYYNHIIMVIYDNKKKRKISIPGEIWQKWKESEEEE